MTRLVISARASRDVREILEHLSELAGPSVAEKYARDLRALYERLSMFPASGAAVRPWDRSPVLQCGSRMSSYMTISTKKSGLFEFSTAAAISHGDCFTDDRRA